MARTTTQLLEQLQGFLPPSHAQPLEPLLGGAAAAHAEVEGSLDSLLDDATFEGAEEEWLTLHAHGQGLERAPSETDAELRSRLRNPERALTAPAILEAVNAILAGYTATEAVVVAWWHGENFAGACYAGQAYVAPSPLAFVVFVPRIGDVPNITDAFAGSCYAGACYAGSGGVHIVYTQLGRLLGRLRAAGIRAWVVVDDSGRVVS